jgi:hypothetical protein
MWCTETERILGEVINVVYRNGGILSEVLIQYPSVSVHHMYNLTQYPSVSVHHMYSLKVYRYRGILSEVIHVVYRNRGIVS